MAQNTSNISDISRFRIWSYSGVIEFNSRIRTVYAEFYHCSKIFSFSIEKEGRKENCPTKFLFHLTLVQGSRSSLLLKASLFQNNLNFLKFESTKYLLET